MRVFGTLIGVSFLLYLILWFAIPKARTPRQRLEMTGERITASSIRRNISADLNDARPSRNERTASVFSELLYVTGRVLLFCIKALLLLIGAVLGLVVLGLVVGLVAVLVGGAAVGLPFALTGGSLLIPVLIVLGIVLPLGIVVYLLLKLVFNLRSRRATLSVLFGLGSDPDLSGCLSREELRAHRGGVRPGRCRVVFQQNFRLVRRRRSGRYSDSADTVRVETVTLGDSTLDTVGSSIIPIAGPVPAGAERRLAFRRNRTKKAIMSSIYRACSHPEESLCLLAAACGFDFVYRSGSYFEALCRKGCVRRNRNIGNLETGAAKHMIGINNA
ncbi:MAG: hypothetical protein ACLR76_01605 [Alistipes sp.]